MNDYRNYIDLKNKIVKTNMEINKLYNKLFEIRLSLVPKSSITDNPKAKTNKTNNKNLDVIIITEEIEAEMAAKKAIKEEMEEHLLEIENQATDPLKFKIFILRWFGINKDNKRYGLREIGKIVHYSKTKVGEVIKEIEQELNN